MKRIAATFILEIVILFTLAAGAQAQDLEPRAYGNNPTGLNFVIASYALSKGGAVVDPSIPLENANIETHSTVFVYARSLNVWGRSGQFDVVLPYAWTSGTAEFAGQSIVRDVSGFGDPRLRFTVNFIGAPALSLQEFAGYRQDLIVGASLAVWAPLGQYDADKVVNIGTNRWSIEPAFGVSKAWGPWTLEFSAGATYYTDNNDFLGQTRAQEPIYSAQVHLTRSFRSRIWVALSSNYYTGGRASINGVAREDLQENSRLGATIAVPADRYNSVKLYANTGVSVRTGTDFDAVGIAWQHRWGAGL